MDYQNKFDTLLININSELLDLKNKFTKLESNLKVFRNVSNKLVVKVAQLERKCWDNKKCWRRECVEISEKKILLTVLEKTVKDSIRKRQY